MKFKQLGDVYALKFEPDDDIHGTVTQFCLEQGIEAATLHAIGSVDSPKLAHYRMDTRSFSHKQLSGIFEIASMTGNVAMVDGKPAAHIHCVVSDEQMQPFAGHLVEGKCSALIEMFIRPLRGGLTKADDDRTGLTSWDF